MTPKVTDFITRVHEKHVDLGIRSANCVLRDMADTRPAWVKRQAQNARVFGLPEGGKAA